MSSSAYSAFSQLLADSGQLVSAAELHGLLLGRSCAGAGFDADAWLADAVDLLGSEPEGAVRQALIGLQEMVRGELTGEDAAVVLLLPDDELPVDQRTAALGQWCQGFLAGFGVTAGDAPLSGEAMEVLQDMAAIAQVEGGVEESEAAESDYMEVMEYLRVAPLLLYAECARAAPAKDAEAGAADKPALH